MLPVPGNSNAGSAVLPADGPGLQDGTLLKQIVSNNFSTQDGITALAGGALTGSTPQLASHFNLVATVASSGDSVVLPPALRGTSLVVRNSGANTTLVYAQGSDTIDGTAGSSGVSQIASSSTFYFCPQNGKWFSIRGSGATGATGGTGPTGATGPTGPTGPT